MVEEDAVRGVHAAALAVVHGDPVGIHLRGTAGAAGPEGGSLGLGNFLHLPIHLGAGGLVETGFDAGLAHGFKDARGAETGDVARVFRDVEAHAHVALRAEMVDLVGFEVVDEFHEIHRVGEVAIVEKKAHAVDVGALIEVVNACGVEGARAADDAMDFVAFVEKKVGEAGAVLAGDACDERFFHGFEIVVLGRWGLGGTLHFAGGNDKR